MCHAAYEAPTMCYRPAQALGTAVLKTHVSHFRGVVLGLPGQVAAPVAGLRPHVPVPLSDKGAFPHPLSVVRLSL